MQIQDTITDKDTKKVEQQVIEVLLQSIWSVANTNTNVDTNTITNTNTDTGEQKGTLR